VQSHRLVFRALLLPLLALAAAACGGDKGPAGVIPREKFVAANVALRSLPDSATPQQRTATLRKHGVTERQLKAWVNGHTGEPQEMAKVWEEIAFKLDSIGGAPVPAIGRPDPRVPPSRLPHELRPVGTPDGRVAAPPPPTDERPVRVRVQ
jgi:hypothetical protein